MFPLRAVLGVMCVFNILTLNAADCGDRQDPVNGRCCDLCPPGTYMKEFCSERKQTVCSPCEEGYYSNKYNIFDRCEECQLCHQEYDRKCTLTTNANCSCRSGFLCSNNVCSRCEENKCVTGEKLKRTGNSLGKGLIEYSYQCEPLCHDKEFYDAKVEACKLRTQCSLLGLAEQFPGNKSHNSVCRGGKDRTDGDFLHVILAFGFVLLSLILFVLLFYACIKMIRKHKPYDNPTTIIAVSTNASDCPLSKEECGLHLIIPEESKNDGSV